MIHVFVDHVTRCPGGRIILKDVTLEVERGETLAIMGPSGSGKTSLLRVINMLDPPDAGRVFIDGRDVWAGCGPDIRRTMVMVFQKPVPFSMSVYDNIAFGLRQRQVSRQEIDRAVIDALQLLDMSGKERQFARSLSGGEVQRLAFARAYVLKPQLLLLDEPTANLDPANAMVIERAIRNVNERYGTTIIVVTHRMHQALRLARRSAFMMDGEIVEIGPTDELLAHPMDARTARFVRGEIP